jgi:hypothetical protein
MHRHPWLIILLASLPLLIGAGLAAALDHIIWKNDGIESKLDGQILVKTTDGGLFVQAPDGTLVSVPADKLVRQTSDDEPLVPLAKADLAKRLLAELPAGFEAYTTQNYLICHNTSDAYAKWCGALFEQLHRGFTNYWSDRGFDLKKPEFPLVAIVFADKNSYTAWASKEIGDGVSTIIGYYNYQTNRMTMYDLTGMENLRQAGDRRTTAAQINEMLSRPEAERTVATIVHEATHQLAFNCGLQTRYSDVPLWVSEGLAIYFETPDLKSKTGWRKIGAVNRFQWSAFRSYVGHRPAGSLKTLIADDTRLQSSRDAAEAYAESWALSYYLIRAKPKQYLAYLKMLSQKPRLVRDEPSKRLEEFQAAFGQNLDQLDTEFLRYMSKLP